MAEQIEAERRATEKYKACTKSSLVMRTRAGQERVQQDRGSRVPVLVAICLSGHAKAQGAFWRGRRSHQSCVVMVTNDGRAPRQLQQSRVTFMGYRAMLGASLAQTPVLFVLILLGQHDSNIRIPHAICYRMRILS